MSDPTATIEAGAATDGAPRFRPIPLSEFVASAVERRGWAVEDVWPERASGVIAGRPKSGKSTLSLELAVSLATPFLGVDDFPTRTAPARVTYVQAENSAERVRRDLDLILQARGLGYMNPVDNPAEPNGPALGERFRPTWPSATGEGEWAPDLEILSNPGLDLMQGEDAGWLREYAGGRDYIFLDPLYLLASANPNDTGEMMRLLTLLGEIRDASGCAVVLTHQESDKGRGGGHAERLIGSTFLHGWYESAIFAERTDQGFFNLRCDSLREMGEQRQIGVLGCGVGRWAYYSAAQSATDPARQQPSRSAAKRTNIERLRELVEKHPSWTNAEYGTELGVEEPTVVRYKRELRDRPEPADDR